MNSYGIGSLLSSSKFHRNYLRGAGFPEPQRISREERQALMQLHREKVAHAADRKNR